MKFIIVLALIAGLTGCGTTDGESNNENASSENEPKTEAAEVTNQSEIQSGDSKESPEHILDYYNLLRQTDSRNFYPEMTFESDSSEFFVVDKKNGFIQFTLDEADKEILQVVLFRDAERKAILAVNRYSFIENWYTWYIPRGNKPEFCRESNGELSKTSFRLFDELAPSQFVKDTSSQVTLPDAYFILPQYGTEIKYVLYPEILSELKKNAGNWPSVDEGYPPPPDWVEDIEAKISSIDYLKQDIVSISFDKEKSDFYLIED